MAVPRPPLREEPPPQWEPAGEGALMRRMVEGPGAELILYRIPPGTRFELHTHPNSELGVILSGEGDLLLQDTRRSVRPGDSFFIPPGTAHGFAVPAKGEQVVILNADVDVPKDAVEVQSVVRSGDLAPRRPRRVDER